MTTFLPKTHLKKVVNLLTHH